MVWHETRLVHNFLLVFGAARDTVTYYRKMPASLSLGILYAGRWFGRAGQHFVDNHVAHLVGPALAASFSVEIFLAVSPDQWCSAAGSDDEATLAAEVRDMFSRRVPTQVAIAPPPTVDWSEARVEGTVSARLLKAAQRAAAAGGGKPGHASAYKYGMLLAYMRQFGNVAHADDLRRRAGRVHDVVLKARIDVQYPEPVDLVPLAAALRAEPTLVFAPLAYDGPYDETIATPQWRDWNLVMSEVGATALRAVADLGNGSTPLYNGTGSRCYGYCVEEQLRLQLEARGFGYRELPWRLAQHRIYHHAFADETAAARAERLERAKPTSADGVAWREAHGLAAKHSDQCSVAGKVEEPPPSSKVAAVQHWSDG